MELLFPVHVLHVTQLLMTKSADSRGSELPGQPAQNVVVPMVLVSVNPDPATPTGSKIFPEPIGVPPVAEVYHSTSTGGVVIFQVNGPV